MSDNFSRQADLYSRYRPRYPKSLFDFILSRISQKNIAWDCATGNGQTAIELAHHFKKVFATDTSQKQLDHAVAAENIFYSRQPAENTDLDDSSVDLITVSQALHWFQFDQFYREVKRLASPHAWIAVWCYSLLNISSEIDTIIRDYHFITLSHYWDKQRKFVDDEYRNIPFPFNEIKVPHFQIEYNWTLEDLEGYLNTWSALQKFIEANGYNPVPQLIKKIEPFWKGDSMKVIFPLHVRIAPVHK